MRFSVHTTLEAVRKALENAGVKFLNASKGGGAGGATTGVAKMQLTRALGEAVIRIWSNLPQEVQNHLFREAVTSQGESIRSQLAVFLHDKHSRTADPLGNPRQATEQDSLGG
jgi:hypothetical protein